MKSLICKFSILLALLILASSCGGGGGGNSGPVTSIVNNNNNNGNGQNSVNPPSANNPYKTPEYNAQNGLLAIKAAEAYYYLERNNKKVGGEGVTIAIADSPIDLSHGDLSPNSLDSSLAHHNNFNRNDNPLITHGTHVAGIAAAAKNDSGMHGVAFKSLILAVNVAEGTTVPLKGSLTGMKYAVNDDVEFLENNVITSANNGNNARVINLSWAYYDNSKPRKSITLDLSEEEGMTVYNSYKYGTLTNPLLTLHPDFMSLINKDALAVIGTGNDGNKTRVTVPAIFAQDPDYAGHVLAVGSVDVDSSGVVTGISAFSNHCSQVKNYCLVAPGRDILSAYPDPANSLAKKSGTSMSTPHVSGAAAVLRAAWPHLKAPQVAEILLVTATDLGDPGVDDVYGHGMLNLYAAVQAQGLNGVPGGISIDSAGYDLRTSAMTLGAIFGDSFQNNVIPKINNAVFFDDFGRDYQANLGEKITQNNSQYLPNLQNIILNNITSSEVPARFGKSELKFNLADYKNSEAKNNIGLKYALIDNSQDFQQLALQNNGMSFTQKDLLFAGSKFGFALNRDEISRSLYPEFAGAGFVLENNFAQNPYQNFLQQNFSANPFLNRKFNQFFTQQNFYKGKLGFNFSYQSSRDGENVVANSGKKQNEIFDASLVLKAREGSSVLLNVGNLNEFDDNILNAKSSGAFSAGNGVKTTYVKLATAQNLAKNLQLIASFSQGFSQISGNNNGIFRQFENVRSRALSLALIKDNFFNGKLGLAYIEPMRVYSGSVRYDVPVARDYDGNVIRSQGSASLAPDGRERNFELFYSRILEGEGSLSFNFIMQREGGNIKAAKDNQIAFVNYQKKF